MRSLGLWASCFVAFAWCVGADAADRTVITYDLDRVGLAASFVDIDQAKEHWQKLKLKSPAADGVVVLDLVPNSPLAKAGMRSMDVITVFDKQKVKSAEQFRETLKALRDGDGRVSVTGYRLIAGPKANSWKLGTVTVSPEPLKITLLNSMLEATDEIEKQMIVRERSAPKLSELLNDIQMRFVIKDGEAVSPGLVVQWVGADDFIGMQGVQIRAGETLLDLEVSDHHIDNKAGKCWEWGAIPLNWDAAEKFMTIWDSKKAILRIVGRTYKDDRELTREEKDRLWHTAYAFELRGGKWPEK